MVKIGEKILEIHKEVVNKEHNIKNENKNGRLGIMVAKVA